MKRWMLWLVTLAVIAFVVPLGVWAQQKTPAELRTAYTQGNYKEAYDGLATKVTAAAGTDQLVQDFQLCVNALNNLGRYDEVDDFREKAIAAHKEDWRFLQAAAETLRNGVRNGYVVSGVFHRGYSRNGDGKYVSSLDRDRVRALQLMQDGMALLQKQAAIPAGAAQFYYQFGDMLQMAENGADAWRLQTLTDLTKLPDYDEAYGRTYYRGYNGGRGAPVDEKGNPILHQVPKGGWEGAKTDGERWRWMLMQASEYSAAEAVHAKFVWAAFLKSQFGVQTMAYYGGVVGRSADDSKKDESGPYAVYTLKDEETIARLATGIKRFTLPDEFNFIKQLEAVAKTPIDQLYAQQAMATLAQSYTDRQQYDTAAKWWRTELDTLPENNPDGRRSVQQQIDQILGNWGMFDNTLVQPSGGKGAAVDFRFRNGNKVSFTAKVVDVAQLLTDVKAYLKALPNAVPYQQTQISDIGYRLFTDDKSDKYVGKQVAAWEMPLEPRAGHFDKRVTVQTPLQTPGAYLLTGKMDNGNTSNILVWVTDTAIVRKPLDTGYFTYVADAVTGQPVAGAQVEFFGYRQQYMGNTDASRAREYRMDIQEYSQNTDKDGQVVVAVKGLGSEVPWKVDPKTPQLADGMNWITTATTKEGRFAYTGFSSIWRGSYTDQYDRQYNQTKIFAMTDRPVYRPAQKVQWKFWVGQNKYDQDGKSPFVGQDWVLEIRSPKNEVLKSFPGKLDEWGGLAGEWELDKDATLGVYSMQGLHAGSGYGVSTSFRVEEYKKPEFEVTIDAPTEPVMLGDKVTATVKSKYYFGSPVTNATVKVKVTRSAADARWYPIGAWDWFYEPGYWWFAHDYAWYPGWSVWGTYAPVRRWYQSYWPAEQPEVVMENEVPVGPDGLVKVDIDTAVAKAMYADQDHKYDISAEVTDASRRTIVGTGSVLVARQPFKVYAWVNRGFYSVGDTVHASFSAQTLDNKPVAGKGVLKLLRVTYDEKTQPVETVVQQWDLNTKEDGKSEVQINAQRAGQYRLAYSVTDAKNHTIDGGYVFVIRGEGFNGQEFRFNDIEVTTDKKEYAAGEKVKLLVNANRANAAVLLFVRPANGVYLAPKVIRLQGKSAVAEVDVGMKDMPNFFVEAVTVADARVYTDVREVIVPPADRVVNVAVTANAAEYKPGEKAKLTVKVTEKNGEPFTGAAVLSLYDKSVEYISGGSNVTDIRKYFWQWRRTHYVYSEDSLAKTSSNRTRDAYSMSYLGVFGQMATEYGDRDYEQILHRTGQEVQRGQAGGGRGGRGGGGGGPGGGYGGGGMGGMGGMADAMASSDATPSPVVTKSGGGLQSSLEASSAQGQAGVEPTVRSNFADTALWAPNLVTAVNGTATVEVTMPENLTTWKARVWTLGNGSRVGQGDTEVVTRKNLIVRLEAPRFFTQTDEVVLSAIIHNYLKSGKRVNVQLRWEGSAMLDLLVSGKPTTRGTTPDGAALAGEDQIVQVDANGEARVDWRVRVLREGTVKISMKAITDEESDAMQMSFPVYVHGMLKTDSYAGALRGDSKTLSGTFKVNVPAQRRPEQTLLEVRYSPSLASAMVDALPYLVDYPYGCTEQTLNRFVPAAITQKVLLDMKLDLEAIKTKRTNLNAQEIGDPAKRAEQWKRQGVRDNPVFSKDQVADMVRNGVTRLTNMQNADGGWGWFSGTGEYSYPHTTALVIHGLQTAKAAGATVDQNVVARGVQWLRNYQEKQITELQNYDAYKRDNVARHPMKEFADDMDAFTYMVLVDASLDNGTMKDYLYRDRTHLAVYSKAMFGLALHTVKDIDKLNMILDNCKQFVVQDEENQSAYLKLPPGNWWYWYGSEMEAQAYYLKLLARTDPKGQTASRLAKYIINNRRGGTYWTSTRDTAYSIEALGEYIHASGEDRPDMTVRIAYDGKQVRQEKITAENLFSFNNAWTLPGREVVDGVHTIEVAREGSGPLYYNGYMTNFTMEDHITKAGLEIKVNRKVYLLTRDDKTVKAEGDRGQAVDKRVEKYVRSELSEGQSVKSGDLVEVELTVDSKNDYEYIVLEDMKGAGFEPVEVRSGYNGNDMNAYVEFHDERVAFFVRLLGRGTHSVSYRLRAEVPGSFSALPTKASAMYAPELRANSDEIKLRIVDAPTK